MTLDELVPLELGRQAFELLKAKAVIDAITEENEKLKKEKAADEQPPTRKRRSSTP